MVRMMEEAEAVEAVAAVEEAVEAAAMPTEGADLSQGWTVTLMVADLASLTPKPPRKNRPLDP